MPKETKFKSSLFKLSGSSLVYVGTFETPAAVTKAGEEDGTYLIMDTIHIETKEEQNQEEQNQE